MKRFWPSAIGGRTGFENQPRRFMRELPKPLALPCRPALGHHPALPDEGAHSGYQRASEVQAALEAVQSAAIASTEPTADHNVPRTTVLHNVQHIHVKKGDFFCWGNDKRSIPPALETLSARVGKLAVLFHGHAGVRDGL